MEPEFERAGINVRFVVIGTPGEARAFCGRFGDPVRCLSDPEKLTYKAVGLGDYNFLRMFGDRPLRARHRENRAAGFRQNWRATRLENAAQLPGAAFFDREGIVRWMHRGSHPGDLPSMREMLDACASAMH